MNVFIYHTDNVYIPMCIYVCVYTHNMSLCLCIYIYIYIYTNTPPVTRTRGRMAGRRDAQQPTFTRASTPVRGSLNPIHSCRAT